MTHSFHNDRISFLINKATSHLKNIKQTILTYKSSDIFKIEHVGINLYKLIVNENIIAIKNNKCTVCNQMIYLDYDVTIQQKCIIHLKLKEIVFSISFNENLLNKILKKEFDKITFLKSINLIHYEILLD